MVSLVSEPEINLTLPAHPVPWSNVAVQAVCERLRPHGTARGRWRKSGHGSGRAAQVPPAMASKDKDTHTHTGLSSTVTPMRAHSGAITLGVMLL